MTFNGGIVNATYPGNSGCAAGIGAGSGGNGTDTLILFNSGNYTVAGGYHGAGVGGGLLRRLQRQCALQPGRHRQPLLSLANRVRYMGIAVAVLTGIAALCILHLSPMTVILYTVVNSFFAGFLENSTYSTFLDMMQLVPEMDDHRPELLAVNDTVLELGRCVGLSIIIVMNVYVGEDVGVQVWSLLVLTLTQVGTVLL